MRYVQYESKDTEGKISQGVCHKSRLEYLAVPDAVVSFSVISDETYAELVESYGGVETAPAAKAKPKKNTKTEGDSLV